MRKRITVSLLFLTCLLFFVRLSPIASHSYFDVNNPFFSNPLFHKDFTNRSEGNLSDFPDLINRGDNRDANRTKFLIKTIDSGLLNESYTADSIIQFGDESWSDYYAEIEYVPGTGLTSSHLGGIAVRWTYNEESHTNRFYHFSLNGDGTIQFRSILNGYIDTTKSNPNLVVEGNLNTKQIVFLNDFNPNRTYRFGILAEGLRFTVFVDGKVVGSIDVSQFDPIYHFTNGSSGIRWFGLNKYNHETLGRSGATLKTINVYDLPKDFVNIESIAPTKQMIRMEIGERRDIISLYDVLPMNSTLKDQLVYQLSNTDVVLYDEHTKQLVGVGEGLAVLTIRDPFSGLSTSITISNGDKQIIQNEDYVFFHEDFEDEQHSVQPLIGSVLVEEDNSGNHYLKPTSGTVLATYGSDSISNFVASEDILIGSSSGAYIGIDFRLSITNQIAQFYSVRFSVTTDVVNLEFRVFEVDLTSSNQANAKTIKQVVLKQLTDFDPSIIHNLKVIGIGQKFEVFLDHTYVGVYEEQDYKYSQGLVGFRAFGLTNGYIDNINILDLKSHIEYTPVEKVIFKKIEMFPGERNLLSDYVSILPIEATFKDGLQYTIFDSSVISYNSGYLEASDQVGSTTIELFNPIDKSTSINQVHVDYILGVENLEFPYQGDISELQSKLLNGARALDDYSLTVDLSSVNVHQLGDYQVTYMASNQLNSYKRIVTVRIVDQEPPVIYVNLNRISIEDVNINSFDPLTDEQIGLIVSDNADLDIMSRIQVTFYDDQANILNDLTSLKNSLLLGKVVKIAFKVTDSSLNTANEVMVTIEPLDTTTPIISIKNIHYIVDFSEVEYFNASVLEVTAFDNFDGNLTDVLTIHYLNEDFTLLNLSDFKTYIQSGNQGIIQFLVRDQSGNEAVQIVYVKVGDSKKPIISVELHELVLNETDLNHFDPTSNGQLSLSVFDATDLEIGNKLNITYMNANHYLLDKKTEMIDELKKGGTVIMIINVSDSSGNQADEVQVILKMRDAIKPIIKVDKTMFLIRDEQVMDFDPFIQLSLSAYDGQEDITSKIKITYKDETETVLSNLMNAKLVLLKGQNITLHLYAEDLEGNVSESVVVKVNVTTTKKPIIFIEDLEINYTIGEVIPNFKTYILAKDFFGNNIDITDSMIDQSKLDLTKAGQYEVIYHVVDSYGNENTQPIYIKVLSQQKDILQNQIKVNYPIAITVSLVSIVLGVSFGIVLRKKFK